MMQSIQRIQRKNVLKQTLFDRYEITELWKEFFFFFFFFFTFHTVLAFT